MYSHALTLNRTGVTTIRYDEARNEFYLTIRPAAGSSFYETVSREELDKWFRHRGIATCARSWYRSATIPEVKAETMDLYLSELNAHIGAPDYNERAQRITA